MDIEQIILEVIRHFKYISFLKDGDQTIFSTTNITEEHYFDIFNSARINKLILYSKNTRKLFNSGRISFLNQDNSKISLEEIVEANRSNKEFLTLIIDNLNRFDA